MANDVTFQTTTLATPPGGTIVESWDEGGGVERQVVNLGGFGGVGGGSEQQVGPQQVSGVESNASAVAAVAVKASAGSLFGWNFKCNATTDRYVKFFNVAAGSVTPGVTVPLFKIGIPAGAVNVDRPPWGIPFSTAISYIITALAADLDTTPVAVDDVHGVLTWV